MVWTLLDHTEAEWIKIFEEVLGFDEHQSTLSRTMNSQNYDGCYEGLVYIRTAWERLQERKSKMTREEAKQKLLKNNSTFRGVEMAVYFIDALEALGLIKFEEENKLSGEQILLNCDCTEYAIECLKAAGYKIVRK